MVLENLEPKENDKFLKKKFFSKFWGVSGPPKPPQKPKNGVLGGPETPQNVENIFFSKIYYFLWALSFPEPSSYLIFNFRKYLLKFLKTFHIFHI